MFYKHRVVVFFLLILIFLSSCSQLKEYNKITAEEFQWQDFSWSSYETYKVFDKAVILLPIQFNNSDTTYWLQLDTGINDSPLYMNSFYSISPTPSFKRIYEGFLGINVKMLMNVKIGNYEVDNFYSYLKKDFGEEVSQNNPKNIVGSLGLDFFQNKILLLDLPNNKFAIADSEQQFPVYITDNVAYHSAEILNNYFAFDLIIGNESYKFGYDTGASIFPLSVNYDLWQKLTGKDGSEPDNAIISTTSWGSVVSLLGSPTKEEVFLSDRSLGHLDAFYLKENPNLFKLARIDGLISNASFYEDSLILIDLINMRFGVVKTAE